MLHRGFLWISGRQKSYNARIVRKFALWQFPKTALRVRLTPLDRNGFASVYVARAVKQCSDLLREVCLANSPEMTASCHHRAFSDDEEEEFF
jgi:hypothetical protein